MNRKRNQVVVLLSVLCGIGICPSPVSAGDITGGANVLPNNAKLAVSNKDALQVVAPQSSTDADEMELDTDEDPEDAKVLVSGHGVFLGKTASTIKKSDKQFILSLEPGTVLEGSINNADGDPFLNQEILTLVKSALENNANSRNADKAVRRYSTAASKTAAKSKDAINIIVPYRGFESSSEAGDIILEEKLKLKSLAAAEWAKQKELDDTQLNVASSMMEAAMGFGTKDENQQLKMLMRAHKKLSDLVGTDLAQDTVSKLAAWKKRIAEPKGIFEAELWAPAEQEEKIKALVEAASKRDAVMLKIEKTVKKYNHKSKAAMAAGKIIEGGLGAACLVPSFVGPGAQVALTAYEMATGGSEENKLLRQIYLGKRRESRMRMLERKAQLALHNYEVGKASHNLVLMAVSESILDEMAGEAVSGQVLGADII